MRSRSCAAAVAALLAAPARAAGPTTPGTLYADWSEEHGRAREEPPPQFQWINYFFARATLTNQVADPAGLRGVSLGPIGSGAGSATRVTGDLAYYLEQRWIPVVSYAPWFVDGLGAFRAQFEVDFMWGRAANAVQPNEGGGLNADEVNVQTKNVNASIYPTRKPGELDIVIGTQALYDSIYDPTTTPLETIVNSGYKLSFLGSDATGLAVYARPRETSRAKLGLYLLQTAQPDKATEDDPRLKYVWLATADWQETLGRAAHVGLSLWRLGDDSKGDAYTYEGLVRAGPSSTSLGSYTGAPRLAIDRPTGSVWWVGGTFDNNLDFRVGRFAYGGYAIYNVGRFTSNDPGTLLNQHVDVSGLAANLELRYKWGARPGDQITLQGELTTGDKDLGDDRYTGAFTLNEYGLPGAVWFTHRTLLLFPYTSTVNNYTGSATDISNQGYGLGMGVLTGAWDLVPNKLNVKVGAAYATAMVDPPAFAEGGSRGRGLGFELNAEVRYTLRYLMTVGLAGGVLVRGGFYDGSPTVSGNPFALFTTYTWYAF
jgi:hypothetical protein